MATMTHHSALALQGLQVAEPSPARNFRGENIPVIISHHIAEQSVSSFVDISLMPILRSKKKKQVAWEDGFGFHL